MVKTFEDDEQFSDFISSEVRKKSGSSSKRLQMALKMVYMEAVQKARSKGVKPKMSSSPVSSSASSAPPPPDESDNGEDGSEDEAGPPPPPPPPPPPDGPAWRP
eukprot:Skav215318  [mRNA]  locus=scaffold2444:191036:191347:+ [translate_table: standard]